MTLSGPARCCGPWRTLAVYRALSTLPRTPDPSSSTSSPVNTPRTALRCWRSWPLTWCCLYPARMTWVSSADACRLSWKLSCKRQTVWRRPATTLSSSRSARHSWRMTRTRGSSRSSLSWCMSWSVTWWPWCSRATSGLSGAPVSTTTPGMGWWSGQSKMATVTSVARWR